MPENIVQEPPKLVQPREHKAKVLVWADLTVADMDSLEEASTVDDIKNILRTTASLNTNGDDTLKTDILLDLYYYTIQFARDNNFTKEQTSAFFSIVKRVHDVATETPFGNVEQCFKLFKDLILCHAVKRPPFSIDLFSPDELRKVTDYVIHTYFRHYKLYKYAFTPMVRLDLSMNYIGVPVTSPAPSEAGEDVAVETEPTEGTEGEAQDAEQAPEPQEEQPQTEESESAKELRSMIQAHLTEEMNKLRLSMEEQIKVTDEALNKKLSALEGNAAGKGGRASSKGKKK
ncbi:coiled-coil domain-containing protein 189 [Lingula anatina]|uniref:Coiled-coil domain-containing protein 189 n=1 Tax=Lingula anatina TaxID=7574 RepID=A0A1S3HCT1_LINAN|nr:coiled-coil domain-containing protein 189-like [Lingula anatina]XP_013384918.1 coiled-coil domain-containing protein 189 [Lingula anatina]|eukprot:XP_013382929.1 coiled-coil domain-containing protein 189-like [Lingula anatina]